MRTGREGRFSPGARGDAACESGFVSRCGGALFPLRSGTRLPSGCAGAVRAQEPREPEGLGEYPVAAGGGGAQWFLERWPALTWET